MAWNGVAGDVLVDVVGADVVRAAGPPTPLNSSVLIFDEVTLDRAPGMVDRAAELGNRRVMVVVRMHCRLTPDLRVVEYGFVRDRRVQWRAPLHPDNFRPIDDTWREAFTTKLSAVFRRAIENGMEIAILPHLDAYGEVVEWRNHFRFDPLEVVGGDSYATALILPTADAIARVARPETRVCFSLCGEMGRSLFTHADGYRDLAEEVRQRQGRRQGRRRGRNRVEVGVSLNHNDVAGGASLSSSERRAVQRLVDGCDFVGFSHYRPFSPPPRVEHFADACDRFVAALAGEGITLPAATPLHLSEVAIGGAPRPDGSTGVALATAWPWNGTNEAGRNPWRSPAMRRLRVEYHAALLRFLATQPGPRQVAAAYLWSEGSWDPQGIADRRFTDAEIVESIREHNAAAVSGDR